jgi:hypothetical protein
MICVCNLRGYSVLVDCARYAGCRVRGGGGGREAEEVTRAARAGGRRAARPASPARPSLLLEKSDQKARPHCELRVAWQGGKIQRAARSVRAAVSHSFGLAACARAELKPAGA